MHYYEHYAVIQLSSVRPCHGASVERHDMNSARRFGAVEDYVAELFTGCQSYLHPAVPRLLLSVSVYQIRIVLVLLHQIVLLFWCCCYSRIKQPDKRRQRI